TDLPVASRRLTAPLADNARCALSAALDALRRVPPAERSLARAVAAFWAPDFDRFGLAAGRPELDDAALERLSTPADVLRAAGIVRELSDPAGEEWLVLSRGYPMERWQERRAAVVERAVELGLWPGPVAAQIAVSAGSARSRKEL